MNLRKMNFLFIQIIFITFNLFQCQQKALQDIYTIHYVLKDQDNNKPINEITFDKIFEQTPQILVGITKYTFNPSQKQIPNLQVKYQPSNDQIALYLTEEQNIKELAVEILVVEQSKFQNLEIVSNLNQTINKNSFTFPVKFPKNVQQMWGKKIVKVYLQGYILDKGNKAADSFFLKIKVQKIDDFQFMLLVESNIESFGGMTIFYNYIVLSLSYIDKQKDFQNQLFQVYKDDALNICVKTKSKTIKNCSELVSKPADNTNSNPQELPSQKPADPPLQNDKNLLTNPSGQKKQIKLLTFIGICSIQIKLQPQEQMNINLIQQNQNEIQSFEQAQDLWSTFFKQEIIPEVLVIEDVIFCSNQQYLLNGNCYKVCPQNFLGNQKTKECIPCPQSGCSCNSGEYFLSDENFCTQLKPIWYFCILDTVKQYNICKLCKDTECNKCCKNNDQQQCQICGQKKFFFKGECYKEQPEESYCPSDTNDCISCTNRGCNKCVLGNDSLEYCFECTEGSCFATTRGCTKEGPNSICLKIIPKFENNCVKYDEKNNQNCLVCEKGYYLLNPACYKKEDLPKSSIYCDDKTLTCNVCQDSCVKCTDPTQKETSCLECSQGRCYYEKECILTKDLPKEIIYDTFTNKCGKCLIDNCNKCEALDEPQTNCTICNNGFYKYQNKCFQKVDIPENVFCDDIQGKCMDCPKNCLKCEDPRIQPDNFCTQCQKDVYLFQGKCFLESEIPSEAVNCNKETKICQNCSIQNCEICNNNEKCIKCKESFYTLNGKCYSFKPQNTFCNDSKICVSCENKLCNSCLQDLNQCESCLNDNFQIDDSLQCKCRDSHQYVDPINNQCRECSKYCKTCQNKADFCTGCGTDAILKDNTCTCKEGYGQDNFNCQYCHKQKIKILNGKPICECSERLFLPRGQQDCLLCKIENCQQCEADGESCRQCNEGFILQIENKKCRYCGYGMFDNPNDNERCQQKCQDRCVLCSSNKDCYQFDEDFVYSGEDCNYRCSTCYSKSPYECLTCSSDTRKFKQSSNSCPCKDGYLEDEQKECKKDYNKSYDKPIIYFSENTMKAVFFVSFPQSFFNINPLNDVMVTPFQIASIIPLTKKNYPIYSIFSVFNFFNLKTSESIDSSSKNSNNSNNDSKNSSINSNNSNNNTNSENKLRILDELPPNQQQLTDDSEQMQSNKANEVQQKQQQMNKSQFTEVLFVSFRNSISNQASQNLMCVAIIWTFGFVAALTVEILRVVFNYYKKKIYEIFIWNFTIKIIRVTSMYMLLSCFSAFFSFHEQSIFSIIMVIYLILAYSLYLIVIYRRCKIRQDVSFQYLYENLSSDNIFERYFWFIIEIKKIFIVLPAFFFSSDKFTYYCIAISCITIAVLVKNKFNGRFTADLIYIIINEIFLVSILSLPLILNKNNNQQFNEKSQIEITRYSSMIIIIFGLFQFFMLIEYGIRQILKKRKLQYKEQVKKNAQQNVIIEEFNDFDVAQLDSILNTTSWIKSQTVIGWAKKNKQKQSEIEL